MRRGSEGEIRDGTTELDGSHTLVATALAALAMLTVKDVQSGCQWTTPARRPLRTLPDAVVVSRLGAGTRETTINAQCLVTLGVLALNTVAVCQAATMWKPLCTSVDSTVASQPRG